MNNKEIKQLMKPITNNQLTKIKQIEKQLGIDLDTDNMSYFEAHLIISNQKFHSQRKKDKNETPNVSYLDTRNRAEEDSNMECKTVESKSLNTVDNHADILIKKVNLTEKEKEEYDY